MAKFVLFKYNIQDKAFCHDEKSVYIDSSTVVVLGERSDWMVYDDHHKGYVQTKAFMINDKGVEYGTERGDEGLFNGCGSCDVREGFQIFVPEFERQFE